MNLAIILAAAAFPSGCTTGRRCGPCAPKELVELQTNAVLDMTECHGRPGVPSLSATVTLVVGATNVSIIGPGTIYLPTAPLQPGANFYMTNTVIECNDTAGPAIEITSSGRLIIDNVTTNAMMLVVVHALTTRKLVLTNAPRISGGGAKLLAGFGHVSVEGNGPVDVACTKAPGQDVIKQELITDGLDLVAPTCNIVDLAALLGLYGAEYEIQLFPPLVEPKHVSWTLAKYTTFYAAGSLLVLVLAFQPNLVLWYKVRGKAKRA